MAIKSSLYRGYLLQRCADEPQNWRARINNRLIYGRLVQIKHCIDWWVELNIFVEPEPAEKVKVSLVPPIAQQENYRGFVIKNDSGEPTDWYLYVRGHVIKGKLTYIKQLLDQKNLQADSRAAKQTEKQRKEWFGGTEK